MPKLQLMCCTRCVSELMRIARHIESGKDACVDFSSPKGFPDMPLAARSEDGAAATAVVVHNHFRP